MSKLEKVKAQIEEILKENGIYLGATNPFEAAMLIDPQEEDVLEFDLPPIIYRDID
ncbi:hypothetical protein Glittering_76 [Bacillus phage Glittering]|uniref:Uncharacterized protein n=2 Tax=Andromedavirus TaxID=1623275 RepID=M1I8M4_9CAUD|nr:hypothetical protein I906_gp75 [Bacillus phage Curly]YP_008770712.1 hypothetical protein Glittering_76 [Bacillus phage Glittering]AGE60762.1 hypothetical protein CURLY_75 [Bacillus phage Curly]AGY47263.1 hypothetical protein Glittering_76 [Bacillus phage Glittering]